MPGSRALTSREKRRFVATAPVASLQLPRAGIRPPRVAVDVGLLFPDGHARLHLVDDEGAACEGGCTMGRACPHAHGNVADRQGARSMDATCGKQTEALDGVADNAFAFARGKGDIGGVFERDHGAAVVVVAYDASERNERAC